MNRVTSISSQLCVALALVLFAVATPACSSEDTGADRTSVPPAGDGGTGGDADAASATPDPTGGRDAAASSCYAACQNTGFTCQMNGDPKAESLFTLSLVPDDEGCSGTLTTGEATANERTVEIKLQCRGAKVCIADAPGQPATACVTATFNAFTFAYTSAAAGGAANVCTRN